MSWTVWILSSACFLALYDLAKKSSVRGNAVLPVLLCSTCFGLSAYAVGLTAGGRLEMVGAADGRTVAFALIKSVIVSTSWIFSRSCKTPVRDFAGVA